MKKSELKALSEKYGMNILRNDITREAWGVYLETVEDVPELEKFLSESYAYTDGTITVEDLSFGIGGTHFYRVECPSDWFDLWGWRE